MKCRHVQRVTVQTWNLLKRSAIELHRYFILIKIKSVVRRRLNINQASDLKSLDDWCCLNWELCIRRCLEGAGYMYFHDCCFSFSRRGFHTRSGHHSESTTSVHKIRELKRCITEKDFKDWIRKRIEKRIEEGKVTFFPTINCLHTEVLTTDELAEISTSQLLCKRYRQLEEEVS